MQKHISIAFCLSSLSTSRQGPTWYTNASTLYDELHPWKLDASPTCRFISFSVCRARLSRKALFKASFVVATHQQAKLPYGFSPYQMGKALLKADLICKHGVLFSNVCGQLADLSIARCIRQAILGVQKAAAWYCKHMHWRFYQAQHELSALNVFFPGQLT